MPRLIDADALVAELQKKPIHDGHFIHTRDVSDAIFNAPTVTPDDVRGVGEWLTEYEPNGRPYQFHCSVCDSDFSQMGITHASNYCPNCGARMEVSEDA